MRLRRWVFVLLCLSVSLLFSQLSSASTAFHVDETATRMWTEENATRISLALVNPSGQKFRARVRLEVLDPEGLMRASSETDETIKRGASALLISLPLPLAGLGKAERNEVLWYRLRYQISPEQTEQNNGAAFVEGIVSLSEITPDLFELRVAAPDYAREDMRYRAQACAVHPVSSRPVAGVRVEGEIVFDDAAAAKKKTVRASGVTNAEGCATLDFELPRKLYDDGDLNLKVKATRGALVEEAEHEIRLDQVALILLSTDKPLYQPGQTLHLRALCFDSTKHALAEEHATLKIDDPEGTTVFRAPLVTSRFGIASCDWPIPENTRLGDYDIEVELKDNRYEGQETTQSVKISRYDLPNFSVNVKPDRAYYLPGQGAEVEVSADYLFGQPVKRGHVRVVRETERKWNYREQKWETKESENYEGETDAQGRYTAHINLQKEHADLAQEDYERFHDLTYAAYFTDPTTNRTEQRRFDLRVTKDAIHIYVFDGVEHQAKNFPLQFYLSTYYADGTPAECEVQINEANADADDRSAPVRTLRTIRTNRYGVAKVSRLSLPRRDDYRSEASLNFVARDRHGVLGQQANDFSYSDRAVIRLETDKSLYRDGEPIKATIWASESRLKAVVDIWSGETVLRSQTIQLKDGRASLLIPYSPEFKAGVTLTAYAAPDAVSEYSYDWPAASRQVLYPRERDLRLGVQLNQQTYKPGAEAHADFHVSAPDGRGVESALGVVVFDKAVEERARSDREFGSNYGFYAAYHYLSGDLGSLSGVSGEDLFKLDLSKPLPEGLELVAEILLRTYAHVPRIFGSDYFEMNQRKIFARLIEQQIAAMKAVLVKRYAETMEYPRDAAALRSLLGANGVEFERLLDPWDTPYRAQFFVEREMDVLEIESAGADKRFETADDFTAVRLSWPYFRPLGLTINRVIESYHARTGGFIRDVATLEEELRGAGVDLNTLRDRWGHPYRFDFNVNGTDYVLNIRSGGPDGKFDEKPGVDTDNFTVWTTTTDYFAEPRVRIDGALTSFIRKTQNFPQSVTELREALSLSNINFDALRDPWGHNYYATFSQDSRYVDRVLRSYSKYGETGKLRQELLPVTQQTSYIHLRSSGADGKEGTTDDFTVADYSRVFTEQSAADKGAQAVQPNTIYTGATGAISGTIFDPQEAVIPGVEVTATHLTTSHEYTTTSDSEGRYTLRNLPVGMYRVQFMSSGFSTTVVDQVPVHSSNLTKLDTYLQVAAATQAVTITAEAAPVVETSASTTGKSISNNFKLDGGAQNRAQNSTPRLREYFPETLVWQPSLETDRAGRAQLDFKLADNITTWKMAVVGSTTDGEVGLFEREIQAFQPFFVEHDPPRVLTEGDEIQLPVVVRNYLNKAQDVNLQIAPASWFTLLGPAEKQIAVPAGDSSRQTFDFRASASVKDGSQQITARAAGDGDAIVKPVSVHPDGEEMATTDSQIITQVATLNLNLPQNTIKDSARAELKIYPNLMTHVFESIEGILHRPYGCGEQTISSTYPSLLVLRHDKRTGQQSSVAPKALRYLRAGYERLLNYRTASGGFSYWGGRDAEADLALTAYALRFLNDAQEFIEVDDDVVSAAREWLVKQQRDDGSWPARYYSSQEDNRRSALLTAYIARVLAATGVQATNTQTADAAQSKMAANNAPAQTKPAPPSALQRALAYLAQRIDEVDEPYLIAAYALAARDAGELNAAARAVAKLRMLAHEEDGGSYWALETNTPFYGWGLAGRIETTALALQALSRENQTDALVNRGLLFLLRQKDRYGVWYSTQATVNVLDALITLLAGTERAAGKLATGGEQTTGGPIEVLINNRRVASIPMPPLNEPANPIVFDLSPFLSPGDNRIELQRDATSRPASVQAVATYYVPWSPAADANHSSAPARASSALRLELGFDKSEVKIGEEVTCKVLAERIGHVGYGMLLGEIGLPPGADVDRASLEKAMKESGWAFSRYDILPDRLVVYLWPRAGGTQFEFKFRPRFGLTAQTSASQLYDYYNPEARTVVAPTRFVVR